jgi:spore germination cell wall hydrolase CwlJ-like protein
MDGAYYLLRRFILALCVWREARGETALGRRLVAQVIENRVQDKRWPDNYESVILQPFQFSSFNKNDPNATAFPTEKDVTWPDCVAAADAILNSPVPITDANHYHVVGLDPAWRDVSKIVATEGHHVFYRL